MLAGSHMNCKLTQRAVAIRLIIRKHGLIHREQSKTAAVVDSCCRPVDTCAA